MSEELKKKKQQTIRWMDAEDIRNLYQGCMFHI